MNETEKRLEEGLYQIADLLDEIATVLDKDFIEKVHALAEQLRTELKSAGATRKR